MSPRDSKKETSEMSNSTTYVMKIVLYCNFFKRLFVLISTETIIIIISAREYDTIEINNPKCHYCYCNCLICITILHF